MGKKSTTSTEEKAKILKVRRAGLKNAGPRQPKRQIHGWAVLLPPPEGTSPMEDWGKEGGSQIGYCNLLLVGGSVVVFPTRDLAQYYCNAEHRRIELLSGGKTVKLPAPICLSNR